MTLVIHDWSIALSRTLRLILSVLRLYFYNRIDSWYFVWTVGVIHIFDRRQSFFLGSIIHITCVWHAICKKSHKLCFVFLCLLSQVAKRVFCVYLLHFVAFSKVISLVWGSQCIYYENATECSKRTLKTRMATYHNSLFALLINIVF